MSIFGWSYSAGCSGPPDCDEGPCEVCGHFVDDCICPECATCGIQGHPYCYPGHGLIRSAEQLFGMNDREAAELKQAARDKAEGDYWADPQRKVEDEQVAQHWRDLAAYETAKK